MGLIANLIKMCREAVEHPQKLEELAALFQKVNDTIGKAERMGPDDAIRNVELARDALAIANQAFRESYPSDGANPTVNEVNSLIESANESVASSKQVRDCTWDDLKGKGDKEFEKTLKRRRDATGDKARVLLDLIELNEELPRLTKQLEGLEQQTNPVDGLGEIREKVTAATLSEDAKSDPKAVQKALVILEDVKLLLQHVQRAKSETGGQELTEEEQAERDRLLREGDKPGNERLDQLKLLRPKEVVTQDKTEEEIAEQIKQNNIASAKEAEEIAEENESSTPEERFKRLTETEYLFNCPQPNIAKKVAEHTAKLLHRGTSLGLSDSEPLLIQYAYQLALGKTNGNKGKMEELGRKLCERMVKKDLFGRYVADLMTGTGAVEQLQNQDATKFYFWSLTEKNVDTRIGATKDQIVERLEKSAAASLFSDLDFGQGWGDNTGNFRVIFEQISGAYAEKAIQAAEEQALTASSNGPAIVITALRGPNTGAVLGKTEWPALCKKIEEKNLTFQFDVYHWGGKPNNYNVALPKYTIFNDQRFKLPCFNQGDSKVAVTLDTIDAVNQLIFCFEDYDEITQRGGPHLQGQGQGGAFAVMPAAFIKTEANGLLLVGKEQGNGNVFLLNDNGTQKSDTGLNEADFLVKADTQPL